MDARFIEFDDHDGAISIQGFSTPHRILRGSLRVVKGVMA
jgi:hypothetical protein